MSYIGKVQIDSTSAIPVGSTLYGAATWDSTNNRYNANTGNLSNIDILIEGLTVHVKFSAANSHASPTLKVGGCDAKPIHRIAGTAAGTTEEESWPANSIVTLTYDGTAWVVNSSTDVNTKYTFSEGTTNGAFNVSVNNGTATPISIHGLKSAAYTESSDYAASGHNHDNDYIKKNGGGTVTNGTIYIGETSAQNDTEVATKQYVENAFSNAVGIATSAMVFKGTVGDGAGATDASVPANGYVAGWTYRVVGEYTLGSQTCEDGDIIIAINSNSGNNASVIPSDWTIAQANLEGAVSAINGESGYIAKFTGNNTITKLAQISQNGTGFLKEDGSWAVPADNRDPGYGKITPANNASTVTALTGNTTQILATNYNENLKLTGANKWIVLAGTNSSTAGSDEIKIAHFVPGTAITNTAPTAAQTGTRGSTFNIPKITIDEAGHVTGISAITVSLPSSDNTDAKVKQSPYTTATNYEFDILFKKSQNHTEETTGVNYSNVTNNKLTFNPSTGTLSATIFKGTLHQDVLGIDSNVTSLTFYHKSGTWKTLSISNTETTIAEVTNGVLKLKSKVQENAVLNMATPS